MDDLADQAIAEVQAEIAPQPSALTNFLRFGYAIADGAKRAFLNLAPRPQGSIVSFAAPYGTAARAGLQKGTIVTEVNGRATGGLSQPQLTQLLVDGLVTGDYSVTVLNPDGSSAVVHFKAEDIRWYVSHPLH